MDSSPRRGAAALGRAGLLVTVANAAANLLAYVVPVLGARRLAPADLGALATCLALVAIATIPGIGLQTAVAVAVAKAGSRVSAARWTVLVAAGCGGAMLLATPLLAALLRLPLAVPPLLALMVVPAVLAGWPLGLLQGGERFGRLAIGTVLLAVGRYVGVVAGLAVGVGLTGSLALGALVAWSVLPPLAWLAFGSPTRRRAPAAPGTAASPPVGPEAAPGAISAAGALRGRAVFAAASASLAILVVSYADLLLARRLLPPGESGAYAVGAVLTRAAIWAPQVVTIVALPWLARGRSAALRVGLALLAAAGLVLVAGTAVASELAVRAVGGDRYAGLARYAPYFVTAGALYAITVFLLNARIAAGARRPAAGVWVVVVVLVGVAAVVRPSTVGQLLACAVAAAAATVAVTGAAVWRSARRVREAATVPG
ncbi:oligosaccharide flippase family protein [Paractinoplanes rishiriensis]|uniref:Polysaccharide biosynthesis protein n=1 Tax=Paractinoplanes rishiriensis TaxID=1050105 RepID=A0A919MW74_9ACTN|nr:oligosaccharide flippase family protein [Actinoplanes rishiriensis]GIE94370.1 hypothetical protein Ari01nite_18350 [Actinoplanes rishiriensis]